MRKIFLGLLFFSCFLVACSAQNSRPLRLGIQYDGNIWLEGEYAIPLFSMAIAPAVFLGNFAATDFDLGIQGRLYPFNSNGSGLYAVVAGIYTCYFSGGRYNTLDSERFGAGYRLIVFNVLTATIEGGWSVQNNNSTEPNSFYGEIGLGVAL